MHIEHIDDILPHIEGKNEFKIHHHKEGYTTIDYMFEDTNTFDNEVLLECRGIKFDADGKILARPLHKFLNLGQKLSQGVS